MRFHSYIFFDLPAPHGMKEPSLKKARSEFKAVVESADDLSVRAYGTLAMKPWTRFMLHIQAPSPVEIQSLVHNLLHTELGKKLSVSYTLMGMTKPSQYNPKKSPPESLPHEPHTYLIVYPFTKTIEWHLLPYDQRRGMMKAHVDVGRKYSDRISQMLLYAYGIDDHEFIVSYQTDNIESFQDLVIELRGTEARRYTKNDLPIFTCIHMPLEKALLII